MNKKIKLDGIKPKVKIIPGIFVRNEAFANMGITLISATSYSGIITGDGMQIRWADVMRCCEVSDDKGETWVKCNNDYCEFPKHQMPPQTSPIIKPRKNITGLN
jgi:hypothetical protein